jgi:hypothetical protein
MERPSHLSFLVEPIGPGEPTSLAVIPLIDFTPLPRLIEQFEREKRFDVAGGYAGLVPAHFNFGPLNCHYLADSYSVDLESDWEVHGRYVLGCKCGQVTCWPLTVRISKNDESVTWDNFMQPHRPERDYSGFGPFQFDLDQYEAVVNRVAERFYT